MPSHVDQRPVLTGFEIDDLKSALRDAVSEGSMVNFTEALRSSRNQTIGKVQCGRYVHRSVEAQTGMSSIGKSRCSSASTRVAERR
jgi:hypothetical protein